MIVATFDNQAYHLEVVEKIRRETDIRRLFIPSDEQ